MMPRGEVGLVFASIGISLNVIDKAMFSAVLMMVMVMVTTLATPPLLKWALGDSTEGKGPDRSVGKQCQ
jgi:Kef-type K+ transport system membrane component KefB